MLTTPRALSFTSDLSRAFMCSRITAYMGLLIWDLGQWRCVSVCTWRLCDIIFFSLNSSQKLLTLSLYLR